jgi:hypothetical protein
MGVLSLFIVRHPYSWRLRFARAGCRLFFQIPGLPDPTLHLRTSLSRCLEKFIQENDLKRVGR